MTKLIRYIGWRDTVPYLLQVAKSGEQHELARNGSIYALGAVGDRSVGAELLFLLSAKDRKATEKRVLIATLARLHYREATSIIRRHLNHKNLLVRIYAARALGELGEEIDLNFLITASQHEDYVIREEACGALGMHRGSTTIAHLTELSQNDSISSVRQAARIALLEIKIVPMRKENRVPILRELLFERDKNVRNWAIRIITEDCGAEGRRALAEVAMRSSRFKNLYVLRLLSSSNKRDKNEVGG